MTDLSIKALSYQGRKAARHRSENRRVEILSAALHIIIKDGVRGVRHRAVAKQANVPLSATTYYFKDINDLIVDAFTYFAERSIQELTNHNGVETKSLIDAYKIKISMLKEGESHIPLLEELVDGACWIMVEYMKDKLNNYRYHLMAKQAFMYESVNNERLYEVGAMYYRCLIDLMERMCVAMNMDKPRMCAELILGGIWNLEQRYLRIPADQFDEQEALTLMKHLIMPFALKIKKDA